MSQQTENVRTRRTRKLLREALIDLIEERGFDRLTVAEITDRGMVSRAAFYRNYRDKFHLVEQIFDEAMGELVGTMSDDSGKTTQERWIDFFEHISDYHRLYGALLGRNGSPWFANKMRSTLSEMVKEHLTIPDVTLPAAPGRKPATGLVPTILGATFVQAITWWLENDRPNPPRDIAMQTAQIAAAIIKEANEW
ncbi:MULTISPECIES: TetR/AcrR family transcriptional regulator [unclassified Streptomyces]|uniref:TetR/AcrR family transcriptional regulator n=1 Tax=unclassified Streptomyces TaxID=2593676 RepID=UPI00336A06BC